MDIEAQKRQAAARALDWVRPGMRLGLGTGSTARHFVDLLGERVRGGLDVVGVPTSEATRAQAQSLNIPLTTLDETPALDLTVDGADEIAPDLTLIKGGGGALLREKIVATASAAMIVIADDGKWVPVLGRFALPIEVMPFGLGRHAAGDRGRHGCRGRTRSADTAPGQERPCFRHGRRALDTRCRARPDTRSQSARPGAFRHPGRGRTRSLYRAGAGGHTGRQRRCPRRRTALTEAFNGVMP